MRCAVGASCLRADVTAHEPSADDRAADAALPAATPPAPSDPFALDARLAEAMRVLRTTEPRIGRLLRVVVDHRLYRSFGYPAFDDYVRERLGIAVRKAWALLKIEKATLRSADFDRAYRDGRLSWVRALSLLPVLDRTTAPAWIARAESVTVRRLCDEVDWVLASRDALGFDVSLAPPPIDSRLPSPIPVTSPDQCRDLSPHARLQIRAHEEHAATPSVAERQRALEVADAEIRFTGPASVVALLRDVLDAFADPEEPRWTALERACVTSSPIGRARRVTTIRSSPATAGAVRCRPAARVEISTTTTSASAPAAATTGVTTARSSARRIISTASTTARSTPPASPRTRSNGSSASDRARQPFSPTWAIASASPTARP